MKVHWTKTAEKQLDSIHSYIAQSSAEYAIRMIDRLTMRSIQIGDFPMSGRKVPEFDSEQIREIIEGNYRIIYYIKADQIDVLCIIHCSMDILRK